VADFNTAHDMTRANIYWQNYLNGYNPTSLALRGSVAARQSRMALKSRKMPHVAASSLSNFAHRHKVTMTVILQAAWANVLSNGTGAEDVAFGVVISGRDAQIRGIDRMVGNFLNTVPLRVMIDRQSDCYWVLRRIYDSCVKSLEHQHLPSEQIVRQTGQSQIFETVVVFEIHANRLGASAADTMGLRNIEGREFSGVPLTLVLDFVAGKLVVTIKFNETVFPTWQADSLLESYAATLLDIMADGPVIGLGSNFAIHGAILCPVSSGVPPGGREGVPHRSHNRFAL
jgi:non-ribosomal peptide synthetase component F